MDPFSSAGSAGIPPADHGFGPGDLLLVPAPHRLVPVLGSTTEASSSFTASEIRMVHPPVSSACLACVSSSVRLITVSLANPLSVANISSVMANDPAPDASPTTMSASMLHHDAAIGAVDNPRGPRSLIQPSPVLIIQPVLITHSLLQCHSILPLLSSPTLARCLHSLLRPASQIYHFKALSAFQ